MQRLINNTYKPSDSSQKPAPPRQPITLYNLTNNFISKNNKQSVTLMKIKTSAIMNSIGDYPFDEVDSMRDSLTKKGVDVIDFGVGDPKEPTPQIIRDATKTAVDKRKTDGYPRNNGTPEFLEAVRNWTKKRYSIDLDKSTEIASNIGSKEAVFNLPLAFLDPGDIVLVPNPGYPPYERGTIFAKGKPVFMNLTEDNNFCPDTEDISAGIAKKAKIMWFNYPNSPTGKIASKEYIKKCIDFCHDNNIILASDEAYSDIYFEKKPISPLQVSKEGVVSINSLSKRSNMTCYRIGWLAGDENIIKPYKKLKANIDSGTCTIMQDAATAALKDEKHVEEMRKNYRIKRDIMLEAFRHLDLKDCTSEATFYIWQKVPDNYTSLEFVKKLLDEKTGIVATPGNFLANKVDGINPAEGYVRFALVPIVEKTKEAKERLRNLEL